MKMNFRQRNSYVARDRKKRLTVASLIVIVLILIFSNSYSRSFLFKIGKPLWIVKDATSSIFLGRFDILKSKLSLIEENETLQKQISLEDKNSALTLLIKKENDDLKSMLNRKVSSKSILASVLVKPYLSAYDTLIIDVGENAGISVGDKVLAEDSYIGYIQEVYGVTSKVVLYSSYGEKVKVLIGANNIEKEAMGLGGGNFSIEVPREVDIKQGDSIIIPSISSNIFGTIEKIDYKDNDALENVLFKNPVNIDELKWVLVLPSK